MSWTGGVQITVVVLGILLFFTSPEWLWGQHSLLSHKCQNSSLGLKPLDCEADHLSPPGVEV